MSQAILRPSKRVLIVIVLVTIVVGFSSAAYAFHLFGSSSTNCWVQPSAPPNTAVFTVVMANEGVNVGFNGSRNHPNPWPVMNVTLGENVVVHVVNNDTSQAHGFTIGHYFDRGVTLHPGGCYDVSFVANQPGSFQVFCDIFCTIHIFMQNGRLNVNP